MQEAPGGPEVKHGGVGAGRRATGIQQWPLHVYSRYKFLTVSLPKRFRNGRFTSETATWIQKCLKKSVGTSRKL
jgi:hypothetical protein